VIESLFLSHFRLVHFLVKRVLRKITNFLEASTIIRIKPFSLLFNPSHVWISWERVSPYWLILAVRIEIVEHGVCCVFWSFLVVIELVVLNHHRRFISKTKPLLREELVHRHRTTTVGLTLSCRSRLAILSLWPSHVRIRFLILFPLSHHIQLSSASPKSTIHHGSTFSSSIPHPKSS